MYYNGLTIEGMEFSMGGTTKRRLGDDHLGRGSSSITMLLALARSNAAKRIKRLDMGVLTFTRGSSHISASTICSLPKCCGAPTIQWRAAAENCIHV